MTDKLLASSRRQLSYIFTRCRADVSESEPDGDNSSSSTAAASASELLSESFAPSSESLT